MPDTQESIIEQIEFQPFLDRTPSVPLTYNDLIITQPIIRSEEERQDDISEIIKNILEANRDFSIKLKLNESKFHRVFYFHNLLRSMIKHYSMAREAGKNERLAVINAVLYIGLDYLYRKQLGGALYKVVKLSVHYDTTFTPSHNKYIDEQLTRLNANLMLSLLNDKPPSHTLNLMYQYSDIALSVFKHELRCLPGHLYNKSQQILLNQALEICEMIDPLTPLLHYDDVVDGEIDSYHRIAAEFPRMIQTGRRLVLHGMRQANHDDVSEHEMEAYQQAAEGLRRVVSGTYRLLSQAMRRANFNEVSEGEIHSCQQIAKDIPAMITTGYQFVSNAMRQANNWEMTDVEMDTIIYPKAPSLPEKKHSFYSPNLFLLSQSFFMDERQKHPITVSNQQLIDFWHKQLQVPSPLSLLDNKLSFQLTSSPKILAQVSVNYYPSNGTMTAQAVIGTALIGKFMEKIDGILEKLADQIYQLFSKKGRMLKLVKNQHPKYNALYQKAMCEQGLLVDMMTKQIEPDLVIAKVTEYERALQSTSQKLDDIISNMQHGFDKKRYYSEDKEPLKSLHNDYKKQAINLKQAIDEARALHQDYPASYYHNKQLERDRINAERYLSALACFSHGSYRESIHQLEDILKGCPEYAMAQELLCHIGLQQRNMLNMVLTIMQSLTAKTIEKLLLVAMHDKGIKMNALLQFAISVSATPLISQSLIALSWSTLSSYLPLVPERFIQNKKSATHYAETGIAISILGTQCLLTLLQGQSDKWVDKLAMVNSYLIVASQAVGLAGLLHRLTTQNIRENPFQSLMTISSGILGFANFIVTIDKLRGNRFIDNCHLVVLTEDNAILPNKGTVVLHHANGSICAYWVDKQGMVNNKTITLPSEDLHRLFPAEKNNVRLLTPQQNKPLIEHIATECGLVSPIVTTAKQLVNSHAPAILSAAAIVPTLMAGLNWFRKDKKESSDVALLLGAVTTTTILAYNYRHSIAATFNSCRFFASTNKNSSRPEISASSDSQIPATPIPIV